MRKSNFILLGLISLFSAKAFAYGVGVSTHPFEVKQKVVTTEATGMVGNGSGVGMQARYLQRVNEKFNFDAGAGISTSERSRAIFAGTDYVFYPEHANQPRISLKTNYANTKEFDSTKNILSAAPTLTKGITISGFEAYPFLSLPLGLSLDWESKKYEGTSSLAFGMTGNLPFEGYDKLIGSVEANVNLKNTYNALIVGLSYPL